MFHVEHSQVDHVGPHLPLGRSRLPDPLAHFKGHLPRLPVRIDDNVITMKDLAIQYLQSQWVLHQLLDRPFQRPSPEIRIVTLSKQKLFSRVRQLQRNFPVGQQSPQVLQPKLNNLNQLLLPQRPENDDVIHPVQKLRLEVPMQHLQHLLGSPLKPLILKALSLQVRRPKIRSHDDHGILEVDRPTLPIGEVARRP